MQKYVPSGKAPFLGILIALSLGLLVAATVGFVFYFIKHILGFSLIFVFPIAAGVVTGFGLLLCIQLGHIRNGMIALLIGLVCGTATIGMEHYSRYTSEFKAELRSELQDSELAGVNANAAEDLLMQEMTGSTGFLGYLKYETGLESSLGSVRRPRASISASHGLMMGLDLLIVAIASGLLAWSSSKNPYDETVGEWYGSSNRLRSVEPRQYQAFIAALQTGDYETAGQLSQRDAIEDDRIDIGVRRTKKGTGAYLEIVQHGKDEKDKPKQETLSEGFIAQRDLNRLMRGSVVSAETGDQVADQMADQTTAQLAEPTTAKPVNNGSLGRQPRST
jgi:hypothetical protein